MQYITLWMKVGTGNKERYIYISKLYEDLGTDFCAALLALHALTGCDFNPAFFKKGKKKAYDLLKKIIISLTFLNN